MAMYIQLQKPPTNWSFGICSPCQYNIYTAGTPQLGYIGCSWSKTFVRQNLYIVTTCLCPCLCLHSVLSCKPLPLYVYLFLEEPLILLRAISLYNVFLFPNWPLFLLRAASQSVPVQPLLSEALASTQPGEVNSYQPVPFCACYQCFYSISIDCLILFSVVILQD